MRHDVPRQKNTNITCLSSRTLDVKRKSTFLDAAVIFDFYFISNRRRRETHIERYSRRAQKNNIDKRGIRI
jgi:hypothetical protein